MKEKLQEIHELVNDYTGKHKNVRGSQLVRVAQKLNNNFNKSSKIQQNSFLR